MSDPGEGCEDCQDGLQPAGWPACCCSGTGAPDSERVLPTDTPPCTATPPQIHPHPRTQGAEENAAAEAKRVPVMRRGRTGRAGGGAAPAAGGDGDTEMAEGGEGQQGSKKHKQGRGVRVAGGGVTKKKPRQGKAFLAGEGEGEFWEVAPEGVGWKGRMKGR